MKKNLTIGSFALAGILFLITFGCGVKEKESKKGGETVIIGEQEWMTKNLTASTFRNGDPIPEAKTNEEWENAGKEGKPAWCYFANDAANDSIYGKLYNWYAVSDPRGIAPSGWHVPSDDEWTQLTDYLGGGVVAGAKMKSETGWFRDSNGTNETGFSGLPGGSRGSNGEFSAPPERGGTIGCWWSSTEVYNDCGWTRYLSYTVDYAYKDYYSKELGFSVRCIKD